MADDEKAKLGHQAIRATELLEPGVAKERVGSAIKRGTGNLALRGLAAIGRIGKSEEAPAAYNAEGAAEVAAQFAAIEAAEMAEFEQKLKRAQSAPAEPSPSPSASGPSRAALRSSFPDASKQFARLIFQCTDLLDQVAQQSGSQELSPEDLRREELLLRIASLLRDDAGDALESFVKHVVFLNRQQRQPK